MRVLLALCFSVHLIRLDRVEGYAEGAPKDQCMEMTPKHGANNLKNSPFSVSTADNTFNSTTAVQVTIKGEFTGFLLQAREAGTANIVGTWGTPPNGTKYLQCTSSRNDAMTHTSNDSKTDLVFNWIPPGSNAPTSIEFIATVVRLFNEWQGNVTSHQLKPSGYGNPAKTTTKAAAAGGVGGAPTTTKAAAASGSGGAPTTTKAAAAGSGAAPTTTKAAAAAGGGGANTTAGSNAGHTTAVGKGGSSAGRLLRAGASLCLGATLAAFGATCRD